MATDDKYHGQRDETGKAIELGPILKVTPDGEAELPPGQTPGHSRTPSRQNSAQSQTKPDGEKKPEENGHWSSGIDAPIRPSSSSQHRFSSFRHSHHSDGHQHPHRDTSDEEEPLPQSPAAHENAQKKWSALRSRVLPSKSTSNGGPAPAPGKVTALAHTSIAAVPVTTELLAGQLPVMILKTWLDRDDEGNRAVPVLLGNLRFRVGDSVGLRAGRETGKEMFKVECEYGDGIVKWVSRDCIILQGDCTDGSRSYIENFETSYPYTHTTRPPTSVLLSRVYELRDELRFPTFQR